MNGAHASGLLLAALKRERLRLFLSVPCTHLAELIGQIARDPDLIHLPVTREEEGVGIAAGAWLGGELAVLLMQNSGLGNSINALASLNGFYRLPLILLISQRGLPGEPMAAQIPMGRLTENLLGLLDIPSERYRAPEELHRLPAQVERARRTERPVAFLCEPGFWSSS